MRRHPGVERLSRHLDDDLPGRARRRLERHLEGCADCRRRLDSLRSTAAAVARLPAAAAPGSIWTGIEEELRRPAPARVRLWPSLWPWAAGTAAAVVALVWALGTAEGPPWEGAGRGPSTPAPVVAEGDGLPRSGPSPPQPVDGTVSGAPEDAREEDGGLPASALADASSGIDEPTARGRQRPAPGGGRLPSTGSGEGTVAAPPAPAAEAPAAVTGAPERPIADTAQAQRDALPPERLDEPAPPPLAVAADGYRLVEGTWFAPGVEPGTPPRRRLDWAAAVVEGIAGARPELARLPDEGGAAMLLWRGQVIRVTLPARRSAGEEL